MDEKVETSDGLVWTTEGARRWACLADRHVYNVRRVMVYESAPPERPSLRWIRYALSDDPSRYAFVQVQDGSDTPILFRLEIDGTELVFDLQPPDQAGAP